MKLLHIGDIHLGCRLHNQSRAPEFQKAFDFLTKLVKKEAVEAVLVAGDVFDTGTPSSESENLYYTFLRDLHQAGCQQVVIIAGNHDSPAQLKAPGDLLQLMGIHVVAQIDRADPAREVIPLGDPEHPTAYICAVPYLRPCEVRTETPVEGESAVDRDEAVRRGIREHYRKVYDLAAAQRKDPSVPILGMGHLYAQGSTLGTRKGREPQAGNVRDVSLEGLADGFAYLALGHIHRPQTLNGHGNWRYAGSLLPMNFREEEQYETQVVLLDTTDLSAPRPVPLPRECFHKMACLKGTLEELQSSLKDLKRECGGENLWVKVVCTRRPEITGWNAVLLKDVEDSPIQILETELREESKTAADGAEEAPASLADMAPEQLFLKYMEKRQPELSRASLEEYQMLFRESQSKAEDPSRRREAPADPPVGRMQFRKLVIQNVNSLRGSTTIDFQNPAFRNGIFLICGPTGAGKTSILDAICLALFAETPRVKITNSRDDVINLNEKELLAELTFSLGLKEYRACFRHARRRSRKNNTLQNYEHTLVEDGRQLPIKSSDTRKHVERLLGMDLDEFTRCVLLAQGSFDAFLKSKPKERVEMLRKITGTERYTEIGRKINEDFLDIDRRMKTLELRLNGQKPLSDEELAEIRAELAERDKESQSQEAQAQEAQRRENAFLNFKKEQKCLEEARMAWEAADADWTANAPEEKRLQDARRAQLCQDAYDRWHAANEQRRKDKSRAEELVRQTRELSNALIQAKARADEAQKSLEEFQVSRQKKESLCREVRGLDSNITTKAMFLQEEDKAEKTLRDELRKCRQEFQRAKDAWEEHSRQAEDAQKYLADHAGDEELAARRIEWEARRKDVVRLEQDAWKALESLEQEERSLRAYEEEEKTLQEKGKALQAQISSCQEEISRLQARQSELLNGHAEEELLNNLGAAKKLEEFFQDGAKREVFLSPGTPCPLCGSTTHPYCEGVPAPQKQAMELCQMLRKTVGDLQETKTALLDANKKLNSARHDQELQGKDLANLVIQKEETLRRRNTAAQEWKKAREGAEKEAQALAEELRTLLQVAWTDHKRLPKQLEERIQRHRESRQAVDALEKGRQEFQTREAAFSSKSEALQSRLSAQQEKNTDLREKLDDLRKRRQEMLGDQLVETLENALRQEEKSHQEALAKANGEVKEKETLLGARSKDLEDLHAKLQRDAAALEELRAKWEDARMQNGFADEQSFLELRMPPQEFQTLQHFLGERKGAVEKAQSALERQDGRVRDAGKELPQDVTYEDTLAWKEQLDANRKALLNRISDLKAKLQADESLRKSQEDALQEQKALQPVFEKRETLDKYFGTTEHRDNFGKVAQVYTFRQLLHYANENRPAFFGQHFTLEMTPADDPQNDDLELSVIDHYQGDTLRTASNLSGGERFEVSLALALGLAAMSAKSKRITLGNVLLDEGFGTLDSNELDSALDLLSNINTDDGKLVGIISHVEKLQERIPTQIQVSTIQGVGKIRFSGK